MPWSEWVQPADVDSLPFRRMKETLPYVIGDPFADMVLTPGSTYPWFSVQYRAGLPDLPTLPVEMFPLTEGIDYGIKPGADPSDPFRFVDYEADAYTYVGWTWPNGDPYISAAGIGDVGPGTLRMEAPSAWDDGYPGFSGDATGFPTYPGGATFATFTGFESPGTGLGTPPDPGPVGLFTITAELDTPPAFYALQEITIPRDPVSWTRSPRFRYWVPIESKVRQVHLDDGRGRTPPRARGASSRYATNRARAYD